MIDDIIEIVLDFVGEIFEAVFKKRRKNKKGGGKK